MDFGTNYLLIVLSVIIGVVIGGVIVFLLDFFLKGWEREAQLAIKNKLELYEPLYDEIEKISENIKFYEIPRQIDIRKENPLTFWDNLPRSIKRRAPKDITDLVQDFYKKVREYFYQYLEAGKILRFSIRDVLRKRRQDLEIDDQGLKITVAKLYDSFSSDFYSGRVLTRKHRYDLENLIKVKNPEYVEDYKMIPISIFNEICSYIEKDSWTIQSEGHEHHWVKEFRESRNQLITIIEEMKKNLEGKIDYVTKNYETRHSILRIICTSLLGKRMKV